MASTELSARLRYLNDSAHLLATTAPATSKYLMSRYNSITFDNELEQSESQRQKACSACGTIMAIGWEASVQVQSQRSRRGKGSKEKAAPSKATVYKCESCNRTTRFIIPPAIKRKAMPSNVGSAAGPTRFTPLHSIPDTAAITASANSSSKKRAKARKKGGLAAILANKKESEAQTSGFALMDFIKPA